jgi:ABC transporter, phosphonate, periplasmic substrate-binding protein
VGEKRFTIAFVAPANPLDRLLGTAPLLEHVEATMSRLGGTPTRLDLRLYKTQQLALAHLTSGDVDFLQLNAKEYLHMKTQTAEIQPLVRIVSGGPAHNHRVVIFTRADTGIKTLSDLRGRSFLFGSADSTMTLLAKAHLVEAGVRAADLSKYRYVNRPEEITRGTVVTPSSEAADLGNPFSPMTPVEAILDGRYDAAIVIEARFLQVTTTEKLVLLKRFEDQSALLVGRGQLPPRAAAHFRRAITDLHEPRILQSFAGQPSAFEPFSEGDVAELHDKLAAELLFDDSTFADVPGKGQ